MDVSWRSRTCACALAAFCLTSAAPAPLAGPPAFRVADLNTGGPASSFLWPHSSDFVELAGEAYFAVSDGVHGTELWRADAAAGASPQLVADLCPGACSSHPQGLTAVGSQLFFAADDGAHGTELWVSDGAGTRLVADLAPGLVGSSPAAFAGLDGKLVFSAHDPARGRELWTSDGTAAGTTLLHEIAPGPDGSVSAALGTVGPLLLFAAEDPEHGSELWATDGTPAGTGRVADICPGPGHSVAATTAWPRFATAAVAGPRLFFLADDCTHGSELWASDGTAANTGLVEDIQPGADGSSPFGLAALGSQVYFSAGDGSHGNELWVSDGSGPGTQLVADVRPGADGSSPREITAFGAKVYFHADDGVHGRELWASDGSLAGTELLADVRAGGDGFPFFQFHALSAVGSRLVFFADDGSHGNEPWASDGTPGGTAPLGDLRPGVDSFFPWTFTFLPDRPAVLGGRLFFRAAAALSDLEVWSTDGTAAGTLQLADLNTQTSAFDVLFFGRLGAVRPLADLGGAVLFPASDGSAGPALWGSDGSAAGTVQLSDPAPLESGFSPQELTVLGDGALFTAAEGVHGTALWRTDGTPAGTFRLAESPAFADAPPAWLARLDDRVLFAAAGQLWASDGTAAGTAPVTGVPGGDPGSPAALTPLGPQAGRLLFRASSAGAGEELWASDGTTPGTYRVADLWPGPGSSSPNGLAAAGPLVFFSAEDPDAGRELWVSDSSDEGTHRVADIRPGPASGLPQLWDQPHVSDERVAAVGPVFFFAGDDGAAGQELWTSDGTEAGTVLVRDIFPGPGSSEIHWLVADGAGSRVYFVADDGVHGRELWTSDGTAAGTRLVEDILPGAGSALPRDLAVVDGLLLFSAHDGVHGVEPWKSNGTAAGTSRVQDIAPGPLPSTPLAFTPAGPNVYFAATDATAGFELWALPRAALSRFADVPPGHWAWPHIEAIAAAGITQGCGNGNFCPAGQVSRAPMAVLLVNAVHGPGFVPPPATGTVFADLPANAFGAAHIEQLASDGITAGCAVAPPRFCPDTRVTRAQMAIFLLRAVHGPGYLPPAGSGTVFSDVGPGYWARDWIEQLAAEGITNGCGVAPSRFCPDGLVTRAEIAVFLARAFDLLP